MYPSGGCRFGDDLPAGRRGRTAAQPKRGDSSRPHASSQLTVRSAPVLALISAFMLTWPTPGRGADRSSRPASGQADVVLLADRAASDLLCGLKHRIAFLRDHVWPEDSAERHPVATGGRGQLLPFSVGSADGFRCLDVADRCAYESSTVRSPTASCRCRFSSRAMDLICLPRSFGRRAVRRMRFEEAHGVACWTFPQSSSDPALVRITLRFTRSDLAASQHPCAYPVLHSGFCPERWAGFRTRDLLGGADGGALTSAHTRTGG